MIDKKILTCVLVLLAGCDIVPKAAKPSAAPTGVAATDADTSVAPELAALRQKMAGLMDRRTSPDATVEAFVDLKNLRAEADCYVNVAKYGPRNAVDQEERDVRDRTYYAFMSGRMREQLHKEVEAPNLKECLGRADKVSVEVQNVTMETPTRALVTANLKNVTPIPEGADTSTIERRNTGETVRYVLAKNDKRWTISQYQELGTEGQWAPYFQERSYQPDAPWIVVPF